MMYYGSVPKCGNKVLKMVDVGSKESVLGISPKNHSTNGELAMQIIEESSGSDDDKDVKYECKKINTKNAVARLPAELVPSSSQPSFGSVNVTNSDHVQFGHNTYFHGNVVIKQIIQPKSGTDNPSYTKTDDESVEDKGLKEKAVNSSIIKYKFRLWHKLVCAAVCAVIIGGICANIFLLRSQSNQDTSANTPPIGGFTDNNTSSKCNMVVGLCCDITQSTITAVVWILLTCSLAAGSTYYFILLTKHWSRGDTQTFPAHVVDSAKNQPIRSTDSVAEQLLIAPQHLRFVSRDDWLAQPPTGELDLLTLPAPWVVIIHTATNSCDTQSKCVLRVRLIQSFHVESRGWYDIGYNFLVGGDGSAYVGRGWRYQGAHTKGYNKYSIAIAFIGTFTNDAPPQQQVDACIKLIKIGVELGYIAKDYKLFAHRQLMSTASPGDKIMDIIRTWPHFVTDVSDVNALLPNY